MYLLLKTCETLFPSRADELDALASLGILLSPEVFNQTRHFWLGERSGNTVFGSLSFGSAKEELL
jgi:hypothetical protein